MHLGQALHRHFAGSLALPLHRHTYGTSQDSSQSSHSSSYRIVPPHSSGSLRIVSYCRDGANWHQHTAHGHAGTGTGAGILQANRRIVGTLTSIAIPPPSHTPARDERHTLRQISRAGCGLGKPSPAHFSPVPVGIRRISFRMHEKINRTQSSRIERNNELGK